MSDTRRGMRRALTSYGDEAFSLFLRKASSRRWAIRTMPWHAR